MSDLIAELKTVRRFALSQNYTTSADVIQRAIIEIGRLSAVSAGTNVEVTADILTLSKEATPSEWHLNVISAYDESGGQSYQTVEGICTLTDAGEADSIVQCREQDARFILALVNAYRDGHFTRAADTEHYMRLALSRAPSAVEAKGGRERLRIQALGAAISRREWSEVEAAHAAIRDAFDRPDIYGGI